MTSREAFESKAWCTAIALGFSGLLAAMACSATTAQIDATTADTIRDGACVGVALITGGDPLTCANATEQLVLDVASDIEAKPAAITVEQKVNVDAQRLRMVTRLAAKKADGK